MKGAFRSVVRKSKVRLNLRRLRRVRDPVASRLATSVVETIEHKIAPEERALIDRIESKRMALIDSDDDLTIIDFGTGEDPSRPAALHGTGVVSKRPVSQLAGRTSKPPFWALLLFKIIREFRPSTCIELGTCLGISAAYQASAQRLNQKGEIITLEGSESLASLAIQNLQELGLENTQVVVGRFIDTLDAVLEENKPIDYVFIDGHHDEKATVAYFEQILPYLAEESIMIFDDISWNLGMRRAWDYIEASDHVKLSLDLHTIGICALGHRLDGKQAFEIPLSAPKPIYVT